MAVFLQLLLLLLVMGATACSGADPPGGFYTTRYDHIEIESILNQKRLVKYYSLCLLDRGPCTPQGLEFKRILPEAIKTNCLRCTEKQRVVTLRSIRRLKKEYPDVWAQLAASWDPTGEYVKQLEASTDRQAPSRSSPGPTPEFINRFADNENDNLESTPASTTQVSSTSSRSTTLPSTAIPGITLPRATPSTTIASTTSSTQRAVTFQPFNSIGPNLVIIKPKALLNILGATVAETAGAVLNTVQFVLKG